MSDQDDDERGRVDNSRWSISRLFHVQDLLQVTLIIAGVGGAVWTTAVWTNNWDRGLKEATDRINKIEHDHEIFSRMDLPKQISMITYRVDTNDRVRTEDMASRKQFETDVRASLDKIIETVIRLQIRLGDGVAPMPPRRQ
jgi:hypothetical protein